MKRILIFLFFTVSSNLIHSQVNGEYSLAGGIYSQNSQKINFDNNRFTFKTELIDWIHRGISL